MTAPLTDEQLDAIEARLAAVSVRWGADVVVNDAHALLADNARLRGLLKDIAAHDYVFDGCRGACAVREEPCGTCWEHDGILAALGKYKVQP